MSELTLMGIAQGMEQEIRSVMEAEGRAVDECAFQGARETALEVLRGFFVQAGSRWELSGTMAKLRHQEGFERAYGRERIRLAGVDIDAHPEWKSIQPFFEMGWKPPTHAEMADHIIGALGQV